MNLFLAAAENMDTFTPLLNFGAVGGVLVWFMLKAEPRMRRIEEAIDRQSKTVLLFMLSQEEVGERYKAEARRLLREIRVREGRSADDDEEIPAVNPTKP